MNIFSKSRPAGLLRALPATNRELAGRLYWDKRTGQPVWPVGNILSRDGRPTGVYLCEDADGKFLYIGGFQMVADSEKWLGWRE